MKNENMGNKETGSGQVRSGQAKLNQTRRRSTARLSAKPTLTTNYDARRFSTKPLSSRRFQTKSGVSMLISLGLVFVIMFFSLIVGNVVVSSIRQSSNVNRSTEAYYAAEGALEKGLLENYKQGAGYTSGVEDAGYTGVDATYEIQGQVPKDIQIGNEYILPAPGTGTVGKNCNPLDPVIDGSFAYTYNDINGDPVSTDADAIDHPCNWNKVKFGETVTIPLYSTDESGTVTNPGTDLTSLKLKLRTACDYGNEMCPPAYRPDLNGFEGEEFFKCENPFKQTRCGDVIVSWQINSTNITGDKTYTLVANDAVFEPEKRKETWNTELYESKINDAKDGMASYHGQNCGNFCVLAENMSGKDLITDSLGSIIDFLLNTGNFARSGTDQINKPVFKFSVINSLKDETYNDTIPYLEYQLVTNSSLSTPPADTAQTIKAEGISGTFKQVLEVRQPHGTGLPEYVVQQ